MPGWLNILYNAFRSGWQIGTWLADNANLQTVVAAVNVVLSQLNDWINTELWSQVRLNATWNGSLDPDSRRMQDDVLHAFGNMDASLRHIVRVVIPDSVNTGRRFSTGKLGLIWKQINVLLAAERNTQGEVTRLHHWVNGQVNPWINGYKKWVHTWNTYYAKPNQTLIDWIAAPALLSAKLTPTMTPDVVNALTGGRHTQLLDKLLGALAAHSPDLPKHYPQSAHWIDRGIVALLHSGKYPA